MNIGALSGEIGRIQERLNGIRSRAGGREGGEVLLEALEELSTSVEELRVAEEELRAQTDQLADTREESERERLRYFDLFHRAPDGYLVTDPAGAIIDANAAAAEFLRSDRDHLQGKPLAARVPEPVRRSFRDQLDKVAHGERLESWPLILMPPFGQPGKTIYVSVTAELGRDPCTREPIIRWTLRDISDLTRLEQRLRDADQQLWVRVAERTHDLAAENERLRAEVARLRQP